MLFLLIIFGALLDFVPVEEPRFFEEPRTSIVWHWEDEFSSAEKAKVEEWLNRVTAASESTLGVYPFTMHFYIHRRKGSSEPVPWASTRRHAVQGVDFHIDQSYSLQTFLEDWTAPHEISHLSIPYLGRDHAWFAEGFASFLQYQIMLELGIYTEQEVREMYTLKIDSVRSYYERNQDFVTVSKNLQGRKQFSIMYWGGASYFMQINERLMGEHEQEFSDIIQEYLLCCRLKDRSIEELIESWDLLLGEPLFSEMLLRYRSAPASEILNPAFPGNGP